MTEVFVSGFNLPEAYHKALKELWYSGDIVDCPDYNTTQLECSMTINVVNPLQEPMISKCAICGPEELEQYRQEILDGIMNFEVEKGNWAYTYNNRMTHCWTGYYYEDQIDFVVAELRRNPYSRRAVIDIRDNSVDMYSTEPACLQSVQFFIRDNKLHCKILFRSNDSLKATFMNAFALIMLQKRIADELGYEVGSYTHRANSFHCYEKDIKTLKSFVDRYEKNEDLTYNYVGDWQDLMEDAKEDIAKKVEELKNR